jgi:RNA polymerase sigma-70 factor (ECF subfamily)
LAYGVIDTEDLVQETIVLVLEKWNAIQKKDSLLPFMIGVASHLVKDHRRRISRMARMENEKEALRKLETKGLTPEHAFDIHLLYQAMEKLSAKEKEALILFEISGFSIKEISDIQSDGESAIKSRLSRSRQKLKLILEETPVGKNTVTLPNQAIFNLLLVL